MHEHRLQLKVGHYGVFNGSRYRSEIQPAIAAFIRQHAVAAVPAQRKAARADPAKGAKPATVAKPIAAERAPAVSRPRRKPAPVAKAAATPRKGKGRANGRDTTAATPD